MLLMLTATGFDGTFTPLPAVEDTWVYLSHRGKRPFCTFFRLSFIASPRMDAIVLVQ